MPDGKDTGMALLCVCLTACYSFMAGMKIEEWKEYAEAQTWMRSTQWNRVECGTDGYILQIDEMAPQGVKWAPMNHQISGSREFTEVQP